jgi:hypothetical protein
MINMYFELHILILSRNCLYPYKNSDFISKEPKIIYILKGSDDGV